MKTERNWQNAGHAKVGQTAPDQEQFRNEFFNPDLCRFEVLGFMERLIYADTHKALGTRRLEKPNRPLGSDGLKEYLITENTILNKGHKEFLLKASKTRPVKVIGILEPICGWEKSNK